jgi:hypothetical protein
MFAGILILGFTFEVEAFNAPTDVRLLASLPVRFDWPAHTS